MAGRNTMRHIFASKHQFGGLSSITDFNGSAEIGLPSSVLVRLASDTDQAWPMLVGLQDADAVRTPPSGRHNRPVAGRSGRNFGIRTSFGIQLLSPRHVQIQTRIIK